MVDLKNIVPIDVDLCREYWDTVMNISGISSSESLVWKECEKNLHMINDGEYPTTLRTYYFLVKIPYFIGEFIINKNK